MTSARSACPGGRTPDRMRSTREGWHRSVLVSLVLVMAVLLGSNTDSPAQGRYTEYQVKAAYLYNFTLFTNFPEESDDGPFRIGIIGEDRFQGALEEVVLARHGVGRSYEIIHCRSLADVDSCNLVFVSSSEHARQKQIIARASAAGALSVGETTDFLQDGGIITMVIIGENVRFQVNRTAAEALNIRMSSRLLRIAERVL